MIPSPAFGPTGPFFKNFKKSAYGRKAGDGMIPYSAFGSTGPFLKISKNLPMAEKQVMG